MPKLTLLINTITLIPILALSAAAQTSSPGWDVVRAITRSTEVRIVSDNAKAVRGRLESVTDSLLLISPGAQSFARAQIVSVSLKRKGHRVRNAIIGIGVGLVAGIGIGLATASRCQGEICGIAAAGGVIAGGVLGMGAGAIAGVAWPSGGWRQVYSR